MLKEVRSILTPPKHWIQKSYALDSEGNSVQEDDPKASCFCLSGAIWKVLSGHSFPLASVYWEAVKDALLPAGQSLVGFNDRPGRRHVEVLAKIDEAIARIEANGP